jgi:drug/metabolite transporter (DMT)-like permease
MTGALLSFSAMAVAIRALAHTLNIFEILAIRSAVGLAILLGFLIVRPHLRLLLVPRRMWLHAFRNGAHYAAQYAWALSITLLPLATVFALEFTMPAWTTLFAALVLGERLTISRAGAILLGLCGVLVILRPGLESFQPASLLVLAAAIGFSAHNIATKMLTKTESTFTIVFWMNVMQLPLALIGGDPLFWTKLEIEQWLPVVSMGVAGLTAHYCISNAFRSGDASIVVPLDFLRILLIAFVGWRLYGEALDVWVFVGAGLIISGVFWNLIAEKLRRDVRDEAVPNVISAGSP